MTVKLEFSGGATTTLPPEYIVEKKYVDGKRNGKTLKNASRFFKNTTMRNCQGLTKGRLGLGGNRKEFRVPANSTRVRG